MKALKALSALALATFAIVGCNKEVEQIEAPASDILIGEPMIVTATLGDNTRTILHQEDEAYKVWWNPGDCITIVQGSARGDFEAQIDEPVPTAAFKGTLTTIVGGSENSNLDPNYIYGVFPASAQVRLTTEEWVDGDLLVAPFQPAQEAVEGSFDTDALTSVARSEALKLSFYNMASVLAITVEEEGISAIGLESLGEFNVGAYEIEVTFNYGKPSIAAASGLTDVVLYAPDYDSFIKGNTYYMAILPGTYENGIKFTMYSGADAVGSMTIEGSVTAERSKIHAVTLKSDEQPQSELVVERLWGLYSTADQAWTEKFGGSDTDHAGNPNGSDRNVTLDDQYVYIAEANKTKNLWAISVDDPTDVTKLPVGTVKDEGIFYLCCPRIIKNTDANVNGGNDVLVVSNMIEGNPTLYAYVDGIFEDPKAIATTTWASRRLGDTFTFAGTLQNGIFFFKDFNSAQGTVTFPVAYKEETANLNLIRRLEAPQVTGAGAYFPYPDNMYKGVCSVRGGGVAQLVTCADGANFADGTGGITATLTDLSGYYTDAAFRFFEFNGRRYVAYTRQVTGGDGRLFIIDGELTQSWDEIITTRNVVYHAAIQNSDEFNPDPEESPRYSGNSGMDLDIYQTGDAVLIAVNKQNVGLSLFKVSCK